MPDKDLYKILGVSPFAGEAEIRDKYRALVKQYHPDQYVGHPLEAEAKAKMQEINEAYDILSDSKKRKEYDRVRLGGAAYATGGSNGPYDAAYGQTCGGGSYQGGNAYRQSGGQQYQGGPFQGGPYYGGNAGGGGGCCSCDTLCALCAADTCCECMGGDLCTCC